MTEDHETRLRQVLHEETAGIDPAPDPGVWGQIQFRAARAGRQGKRRARVYMALSAAAVLVGVVAVASLVGDDSGTDVEAGPAERPETPVTTPNPAPDPATEAGPGIWPFRTGDEADAISTDQWDDPVFTAERFLRDYVGLTRLVMGDFATGDSRSGEVTATTRANGPVTTVLVRRLGSGPEGPWTVIGAATENIILERPTALAEVTSPVHVQGRSTAFEGNVVVEVREDGQTDDKGELGLTPLIGGSMGELGPLEGEVPFRPTTATGGAVVAYTSSAMDGAVEEVAAVRVLFAGASDGRPEFRPIAYDGTSREVVVLADDGTVARVLGNLTETFDADSAFGGLAVSADRRTLFLSAIPYNRGRCTAQVASLSTGRGRGDAARLPGRAPAVSWDGRRLAVATDADCDGLDELTIHDLDSEESRRFPDLDIPEGRGTALEISHLSWSPDGNSVAYEIRRSEVGKSAGARRGVQVHDVTMPGTVTGDARRLEPDDPSQTWMRPAFEPPPLAGLKSGGVLRVAVACCDKPDSTPPALLYVDPATGHAITGEEGATASGSDVGVPIASMSYDRDGILTVVSTPGHVVREVGGEYVTVARGYAAAG